MNKSRKNSFELLSGPLPSYPPTRIQANVGRLCNLSCNHCHLAASPCSTDIMPWKVMIEIIRIIDEGAITGIDITGGAPELNPNLRPFIDRLCQLNLDIQLRTNLVALLEPEQENLADFLYSRNVNLVASLPCYLEANIRAQRGDNVFEKSIAALKMLNRLGYGKEVHPTLDLAYNPSGAFLPGCQEDLEIIYRRELHQRYNISFNKLFVLTNVPIGRYKTALQDEGQLEGYIKLLQCAYNRDNLSELMCRNQVSVKWDGTLYDCDFNLALNHPVDIAAAHVANFDRHLLSNRAIITGDHCFSCTAGAGSSCGGALEASE